MLEVRTAVIIFVAIVVAAAVLVGLSRRLLLRHQILDRPNARSSHETPTPRGGGLGVLAILLPAWVVVSFTIPSTIVGDSEARWVIPLAALLLAAV